MRARYLVPLLATQLLGCRSTESLDSSEIDEDAVYGVYEVSYSADEGRIDYWVQYRIDDSSGDTVRLRAPSEIRVNGVEMNLRDGGDTFLIGGSFYRLEEMPGSAGEVHTFEWTRTDGSTYTNAIEPSPVEVTAPSMNDTHSRSEDLIVRFSPTVGEDEEVECAIMTTNDVEVRAVTAGEQFSYCRFDASSLSNLNPEAMLLEVRRTLKLETMEGHQWKGGYISYEYIAPSVSITFAD